MTEKPMMVPIGRLVMDYRFYPRTEVQSTHVSQLVEAMRAGATLPPLVVDAESYRIIDGFHRYHAYQRLEWTEVPCLLRHYASEADMLLDAVRLNASHGRPLAPYERKRCVELARQFGLSLEAISGALHIRVETAQEWVRGFVPTERGEVVPIKRGLTPPSDTLKAKQEEVNAKWGGMNPTFYARQLIAYLEGGFYRPDQEGLRKALDHLTALWRRIRSREEQPCDDEEAA